MKYINDIDFKMDNTCVGFGDFDGVHSGHRAVIDKLREVSVRGLTSVVLSFEYDEPLLEGKKILATEAEKRYLLEKNGPDVMVSYKVNAGNKDIPVIGFIGEVLIGRLGAKVIVSGSDSKYIGVLRECASIYGYTLVECETVLYESGPVTAGRITQEMEAGRLQKANEMLGHPYLIIGEVLHGKARGRTVGMPTANIGYPSYKQLPEHGVYGTLSDIGGKVVKGLTNIGRRPSDDNFDYVSVEAFLLDFSDDIYGKTITLEIHVHIRGVIKFNNLEEVKLQVNKDIVSIRAFLDKY